MTAAEERIAEAAAATTGEVLTSRQPHRGQPARDRRGAGTTSSASRRGNRHFAGSSQPARAKANEVSGRTQRKLDELARLRPDLLERVRARELSVHRACVQAGFGRDQTPLEKAQAADRRLGPAGRKRFLSWVQEQKEV
jgi:hypothetical protein